MFFKQVKIIKTMNCEDGWGMEPPTPNPKPPSPKPSRKLPNYITQQLEHEN